ncbi:MAG: dTMP kinase [Candidatus Woesearchaeota archaeon]
MLIVIEGTDGSGKATQAELLKKRLEQLNKKVTYFDFPQYDKFFGKLVGRYLNNEFGDAVELNPYLTSLIYAADRFSVKDKLIEANKEIVIANRYVTANLAHQGSKINDKEKINEFINWVEELEYNEYGLPQPDIVIFLYVPIKFSQQLVDKKNKRNYTNKKRDSHESNTHYLEKTANLFKDLSIKKNWIMINCVKDDKLLSIKEISNLIFEKVKIHL